MKNRKVIPIIRNNQREEALLDIDRETPCITLTLEDNDPETYSGADIYDCLGDIIKKHSDIKFLCKGAKRDRAPIKHVLTNVVRHSGLRTYARQARLTYRRRQHI